MVTGLSRVCSCIGACLHRKLSEELERSSSSSEGDIMASASSEKVWLNNYPPGVPREIDLSQFATVMEVFDRAVHKYKNGPAFSNMGATVSFEELDHKVGQFASFLQNEL